MKPECTVCEVLAPLYPHVGPFTRLGEWGTVAQLRIMSPICTTTMYSKLRRLPTRILCCAPPLPFPTISPGYWSPSYAKQHNSLIAGVDADILQGKRAFGRKDIFVGTGWMFGPIQVSAYAACVRSMRTSHAYNVRCPLYHTGLYILP